MEAASGSKAMMSCSALSGEARPAWKTEAEAGTQAPQAGPLTPCADTLKEGTAMLCWFGEFSGDLCSTYDRGDRVLGPEPAPKHCGVDKENVGMPLGNAGLSGPWGLSHRGLAWPGTEMHESRGKDPKALKTIRRWEAGGLFLVTMGQMF